MESAKLSDRDFNVTTKLTSTIKENNIKKYKMSNMNVMNEDIICNPKQAFINDVEDGMSNGQSELEKGAAEENISKVRDDIKISGKFPIFTL